MTRLHKIAWIVAVVFIAYTAYGWLKSHDAQLVLQSQLQADKTATAKIAADEIANKQQLQDTLTSLALVKQQVVTTPQIVKTLPTYITLPQPIQQVTKQSDLPDAPKVGDLIIPEVSAKAFFDAQVECKANAVKLDSCYKGITAGNQMLAVKDTEIKQLNQALKGGTKWQRTKTALKWTAVGVAVGAATIAVVHK